MTAEKAREITDSKKLFLSDFLDAIKSMANSGNSYATLESSKFKDPDGVVLNLRELGFHVEVTGKYITANW